ncbi:hypothetical protein FSP39_019832 [Pinctada imbricata]|uniref:ATP-dependent RNA helicase n=1 Tax=Pinctada imbricata TaxID=66713 RepID=A0AA88XT71_PINIB|nr:hypothetical protein FSP39_019832 [Pinctada imbricata]
MSKIHVKPKSKWKNVKFESNFQSNDNFRDLICFQELTDYEIVSNKSPKKRKSTDKENGDTSNIRKKQKLENTKSLEKVASGDEGKKKKKKRNKNKKKASGILGKTDVPTDSSKKKKKSSDTSSQSTETDHKDEHDEISDDVWRKAWTKLYIPDPVMRALHENKFYHPTPIQALAIPHAIRDRMDIVGAAQTGSGKTLGFGIPVIHNILRFKEKNQENEDGSELDDLEMDQPDEDMIISDLEDHEEEESDENEDDEEEDIEEEEEEVNEIERGSEEDEEEDSTKIGCVKVIDDADFSSLGFPSPKLSTGDKFPLALILEPTRELAIQVKNHLVAAAKYCDIKIATVVGGMSIEKQKRVLKKNPEILVATPGRLWELIEQEYEYLSNVKLVQNLVIDEADRMIEKGHFEELTKLLNYIYKKEDTSVRRQSFVFSATLTMVHSGPQRHILKKTKLTEEKKLELLMKRIKLRGKPKVIDLTKKTGTVETLTEARINCTLDEKDVYLYYFLLQHPGRTLVFANSKDCIRRMISVLTLLKTNPLPLHADMHQRQRLKNLDRFTANPRGLLIASDVAARGLDIPDVQHVIHYQVPGTVENYVHRSGRTARAMKEGLSVMLVGPDDVKNYRKIIHNLNKSEDLPLFPIDQKILPSVKKRVSLTRQIDTASYRFQKKKRENEWFEKAAKEMDMEFDEDLLLNDLGDSSEQAQHKQYVKHLKAELDILLRQSIVPKTFSGKYITRTGKLLLPEQPGTKTDAISKVKTDKPMQDKMNKAIQKKALKMATVKHKTFKKKKKSKRK